LRTHVSKRFPGKPLHQIPQHGPASETLWDYQAQAGRRTIVLPIAQLKPFTSQSLSTRENRGKFPRASQTVLGAEKHRPIAGTLQTPSRCRPLARRARMTARPPRVRIRTKKP